MVLRVEGLSKSYRGRRALSEVGFGMREGELVSIIGPSGAGKTTLLKLIAGLERPDTGRIEICGPGIGGWNGGCGGSDRFPPAILVFQEYALFPHLTIFENVAFGLRARRIERKEITDRVDALLDFFGLEEKSGSYPAELSSGQKQRVTLARALVIKPLLLLLDEPFANLDRGLKASTAEFVRRTIESFGTTTLCVTHDQTEAFAMSDRIGIIFEGELVQMGSFDEIYNFPVDLRTAEFAGRINRVPAAHATVLGLDSTGTSDKEIVFRAEELEVDPAPEGPGTIRAVYPTGPLSTLEIDLWGLPLYAIGKNGKLAPGDHVTCTVRRVLPI